jgi:hypothetical protein
VGNEANQVERDGPILAPKQAGKRPPWWRFSLREFLLAVTAIAALIALAVKLLPSSPSQFDPEVEFKKLCAERGINVAFSGSGSSTSLGPGQARRRWDFESHQDRVPLGQLVAAFRDRVEEVMRKHGCRIHGQGSSGPTDQDLSSFDFSYRSGSQEGELVVESIELPRGEFHLYVFCLEFTSR